MDTEKIIQDLNRRFAAPLPEFYKRRVIFWYDEDKEFVDQVNDISLDNAKIIKATGSNSFTLKKLLAMDDTGSNYLVYCPFVPSSQEENQLLNIELYSGEPFRADLYSIWMDEMRLPSSLNLRSQVRNYQKFFKSRERRAKTAAFADNINRTAHFHLAVLAVVCGARDIRPQSILRAVLQAGLNAEDNTVYAKITEYKALDAFWMLAEKKTGCAAGSSAGCTSAGANAKGAAGSAPSLMQLAAHILLTAASRTLKQNINALDSLVSPEHQPFCYDFVSEWVHSDPKSLYNTARAVEEKHNLYQLFSRFGIADLQDTECFPCINEAILARLMNDVKDEKAGVDDIVKTVEKRRTMAWYDTLESWYEGLFQLACMQQFQKEHYEGFHTAQPLDIWKLYTSDYYRMDSFYRGFQLCFQRSLNKSNDRLDDLFKHMAEKAEALYSGWYLAGLGSNWSNIAAEDLEQYGAIQGVPRLADFYRDNIQGCDNRIFVIISDALRYEVAASLADQLRLATQSEVELSSMCGIFPTVTHYGMAALLPHKELSVQKKPNGGLSVLADGMPTESQNRRAVLQAASPKSTALQYSNIIGLKRAERQALVKGMDVVYIYHNKIDEASHTSDSEVFPACEKACEEIRNLVRIICNEFGGTRILITADHGFLYTYSPLTEDDKVSRDSWQNKEVEYGRRYAVMQQDAAPDYLLPVRFLDGNTGFRAFAPSGNVRIKMNGGGLNFVHGGISLQELAVPLISFHYLRTDSREYQRNRAKIDTRPVEVSLLSSGRKISNMIFSLDFCQKEPVGSNREQAAYALYFTDSDGSAVSDIVRIIADKTSASPDDRIFHCAFSLKSRQYDNTKIYHLVIENENSRQQQKEVFQIDIPFAVDDFDF